VRLGIENWKCPIAGIGAGAGAGARVNLMDQRRFERERDRE